MLLGSLYTNSISSQYLAIKPRLHVPNSWYMIPTAIPNILKLKEIPAILISNLVNSVAHVSLQYKFIIMYRDRNAINTPIQVNILSPPIKKTQNIPVLEKMKDIIFFLYRFHYIFVPKKNKS